jgi:hypothetical protein
MFYWKEDRGWLVSYKFVIDTAEILHLIIIAISTVSLTPLKSFKRCQWHHWNQFSVVNNTAEIWQKKFCRWHPHAIFHFTIMVFFSVVALIPRKWLCQSCLKFQWCHWHCRNSNIIDYFGEYEAICETVLTIDISLVDWAYKSSTCDVMYCRQRRHLYYGGQI